MEIVGERRYVEIGGERTHELPPLLVNGSQHVKRLDKVMTLAADIVESEDMLPGHGLQLANGMHVTEDGLADLDHERRKMDLALNLAEQYLGLVRHWRWGDSVIEWIRQCEITFENRVDLRHLLRGDVWPHAGRSSFVTLLTDKHVETGGISLEKAVGLRLSFRQLPPISCCTNQFLFYLNDSVATSAYRAWARLNPDPVSALPPERFVVQVVDIAA